MTGANMQQANLSIADFREADLRGADLSKADLSKANLSGADLGGAYMIEANLEGINNWTQEQLAKAVSIQGAIMPDGTVHE